MFTNNEGRVPTTDEMDEVENPEDRYKLVMICTHCAEWHWFTGSKDRFLQGHGEVCEHCGGKSFTELRSQRTWNQIWAKQIEAKIKRKLKK